MTREQALTAAFSRLKENLEFEKTERQRKIEAFAAKDPELNAVINELAALGTSFASVAFSGNSEETEKIIKKMEALGKTRDEILKKNGVAEINYTCKKCEDTGHTDDGMCDCVKELANKIYFDDFAKNVPVKECRFDNFDLSFYGDAEKQQKMSNVLSYCKNYVESFNPATSNNLIFMGTTGSGKTHLSVAIVRELVIKGFTVYYASAQNLFSAIETEHFGSHSENTFNEAMNSDLLVIDDLGSEFCTSYVKSLVYTIVNTRMLSGKPIFFNTNLSMQEINERYSPRVASRIIGEYDAKIFDGPDIRQLKKVRSNM